MQGDHAEEGTDGHSPAALSSQGWRRRLRSVLAFVPLNFRVVGRKQDMAVPALRGDPTWRWGQLWSEELSLFWSPCSLWGARAGALGSAGGAELGSAALRAREEGRGWCPLQPQLRDSGQRRKGRRRSGRPLWSGVQQPGRITPSTFTQLEITPREPGWICPDGIKGTKRPSKAPLHP